MSNNNSINKGSNLIDYVLPCVLIFVSLLVAMILLKNTDFSVSRFSDNSNVIAGIAGKSLKKKDIKTGLFKEKGGQLALYTLSGKTIIIPQKEKDIVENAYIESISRENSRLKELTQNKNRWQDPVSYYYYLDQYSFLIKKIGIHIKDLTGKKIVLSIAEYGEKISRIAYKLNIIRNILYEEKLNYEIYKLFYQESASKWKDIWIKYFECFKNPDLEWCPINYSQLSEAYSDLNNSYLNYKDASNAYKDSSKKYLPEVKKLEKELKYADNDVFNLLLTSLDDYKYVSRDTKNLIIALGGEIKEIKTSISIYYLSVVDLSAEIKLNTPNIKEKISYFDSADITINLVDNKHINCIATCLFENESNCKQKCVK